MEAVVVSHLLRSLAQCDRHGHCDPLMQESRPLVSVLIVNFNPGMLRRSLDALARQQFRDLEVVVVGNGSKDGSTEDIVGSDPPVRVVQADGNLGFAGGNNLAAKHARATAWLVLLNPDAFTEPGRLGALVDSARTHPSFAMFGKG
jgi:GT2 family glycosyltransferase